MNHYEMSGVPIKQQEQIKTGLRRIKADLTAIQHDHSLDLAVWAVKGQNARCRLAGSDCELTLKAERLWDIVPGEIVTVHPVKDWTYAGHPYLSAKILKNRLDIPALKLTPLKLKDEGIWDPADEYWGEEGEDLEDWARPIVEFGPRPEFEMEQVIPGQDPEDPFDDPIIEANELNECGNTPAARKILMDVLAQDLRCLDAHAHLGNILFDRWPEEAIRHYEVGIRIGELTLGDQFSGILPWGLIDNRPFLRCLNGFGLCVWRLGRMTEAAKIFERLLWLNPSDNQGARFNLYGTRAGRPWEEGEKRKRKVQQCQ